MGIFSRIKASINAFSNPGIIPSSQSRTGNFPTRPAGLDVNALKMSYDAFSQPVWGPEISTLGAYSREGYNSKSFEVPYVPFSTQQVALQTDEDVNLAINDLSAKITGSDHYWKAMDDQATEYISKFSHDLQFDIIDTTMVRELLWYGNTVWKPRLGIQYIRNRDDIIHIPISSFQRIWLDRQRVPYKYEFRGPLWQGYHNADDIIHLTWNPINASPFGTGFGIAMTTQHTFSQITPAGPTTYVLPSMLDRKYATQFNMHIVERRYLPHNAYVMPDSTLPERQQAQADLASLSPGEDMVFGLPTEVIEMGSTARAFNPTQFQELTMSSILKALNDFRGKNSGESGHQYANAKTAALLDEIGLSNFPKSFIIQLTEKLFKPWYNYHTLYSMSYGGGIISMPWTECKYDLNFGQVEKKNMPPEILLQFLQFGTQSGAVNDPIELRDIMEEAGVPLKKEYSASLSAEYNPSYNGYGQTGSPAFPSFDTSRADQSPRPMDDPAYGEYYNSPTSFFRDTQPSDPRLNFTIKKSTKEQIDKKKLEILHKLSENLNNE